MSFWDGPRWVDKRPAATAAHPCRHLREWLATVPIVLLFPAVMVALVALLSRERRLAHRRRKPVPVARAPEINWDESQKLPPDGTRG